MAIMIKCPYCFETFEDSRVHFRSEYVNIGTRKISGPDGMMYDNINELEMACGDDYKDEVERIKREYKESSFYNPGEDEKYTTFWKKFNGTTEVDSVNTDENKKVYKRKVIDPTDVQDQKHLLPQTGGDYLIRDPELRNMVTSIKLCDGDRSQTSKRVCRYCHNPLPDVYGLYPVKFISVVGIVGSGKTVFLSQFMKGFDQYAAKCGLSPFRTNAAITQFLNANRVKTGNPLPQPTAAGRFEQPLIYNIERSVGNNRRETVTIVMYDIAGEVFKDEKAAEVHKFAPFIKQSDGIILLMDPRQFETLKNDDISSGQEEDVQSPSSALRNIHSVIMESTKKYEKPVAVCISKIDAIASLLPDELKEYISTDYEGEREENSYVYKQVFNMRDHLNYDKKMEDFIAQHDLAIMTALNTGYQNYRFFGITAVGANAEIKNGVVQGHIQPRRIEEPILWMLNQIGLIGSNEIECPRCYQRNVYMSDQPWTIQRKKTIVTGRIFHKEETVLEDVRVNCKCKNCGLEFFRN